MTNSVIPNTNITRQPCMSPFLPNTYRLVQIWPVNRSQKINKTDLYVFTYLCVNMKIQKCEAYYTLRHYNKNGCAFAAQYLNEPNG